MAQFRSITPSSMNNKDLFSELTVLELSSVLAGPAVGLFFAELGARVIKVENASTNGDVTRHWKTQKDDPESDRSAYYHSVNWNKETHLINLDIPEEKGVVLNWIKDCDIVVSNFKHGSSEKLGMDYDSLKTINDQLIYASISAYGKNDPRPGFDVSMQAETGWVYMNGDANGLPAKLPVALIDILAAHQLKEGILVALLQRMKTGKGCEVDVSLFDSSVASLANQASNWLNLGLLPQRMGCSHPNISPYGDLLLTKDHHMVMITAGTQKQFHVLCDFLELTELTNDPKFDKNNDRVVNRQELIDRLQSRLSESTLNDLRDRDEQLKSVMVPVQNLQQVFENESAQKLILKQTEADGTVSQRVKTAVFNISE